MLACLRCHQPMPPEARFCRACGAARPAPVLPAPAAAPPGVARRWWQPPVPPLYLGLSAAAVIIVAFAAGALRADPGPSRYASADESTALSRYGRPTAWLISDGPIAPGQDSYRVETWYYPARGMALRFVNGAGIGSPAVIEKDSAREPSPASPQDLHAGMSIADVEERLGERGALIDPAPRDYEGSTAYLFARSTLLVSFLQGRFFTAQTY